VQRIGNLQTIPVMRFLQEWNHFKILVWPYKTDVIRDYELYRKLSLGGFQIDRGAGQDKKVNFSSEHNFPYYVGHVADKGYLYLIGKHVKAVADPRNLVTRPYSLADPQTMAKMKEHIWKNIKATKKGKVLAYAFDDEISLGSLTTPCDVDKHPLSIDWFREWAHYEYQTIGRLNGQWGTKFSNFSEVMPQGFEEVRKKIITPILSQWNLSPWIDFRHFMDFQFSAVLSELIRYANSIDSITPAGFVGGQGPGPWGGYDYAMLSRAVQWMEAYDIHATNEILRSFWNKDRRLRMQTFFSTKNPKSDSWFLWYYMLHGNQAVIAWPDGWFHSKGYDIAPYVIANRETFEEIQGKISETIVNPKTIFDPDPIGIYYSHPSIQASWAMDAITHGKTWFRRKGSIDNENQSKGILRKVWCKTLEDLGFQYDFISYLDVNEGKIDLNKQFKVIVLPKTICLSDKEAHALKKFVENGGTLIVDYLCGVLDEHGKGRSKGVMDEVFGIVRDESSGYMNGKGLTEIDGEKYQKPYLKRFTCNEGAYRHKGIIIFENGTKAKQESKGIKIKSRLGLFHDTSAIIKSSIGKGSTFYLNLSPLEYWSPSKRFGKYGEEWRKIISQIMKSAGLSPRVVIYEKGKAVNMIEPLFWKNGKRQFLALVKNPTEKKEIKQLNFLYPIEGVTGNEVEIQLAFQDKAKLINLRTGENLGYGQVFNDTFKPWQGNLYEVIDN